MSLSSFSYGQDYAVVQDLELWNSLSASKKVGENFKFSLNNQYRLDHNMGHLNNFLVDGSVRYKFNKYFKVRAGYRFFCEQDATGEDWEYKHRIYGDLLGSYKLDRFRFSYRFRVQRRNDLGATQVDDRDVVFDIRNKLGVEYNIKGSKITPFTAGEFFWRNEELIDPYWNKFRFTIGAERKFKNIGTFDVFYRIESEFTDFYPKTTYILGWGYSYKF
jgi:hypothetical protein